MEKLTGVERIFYAGAGAREITHTLNVYKDDADPEHVTFCLEQTSPTEASVTLRLPDDCVQVLVDTLTKWLAEDL